MRIHLIAAAARDGVIGADGGLPWNLPADLAHFKRTTLGHCVVMGRKTHESIGRPLPERTNIVLTRQPDYAAPGCLIAGDLAAALELARERGESDVFVIGGAETYALALPFADDLHLTEVHADLPGDVAFPAIDSTSWQELSREARAADSRNAHAMTFVHLRRRSG